MQFNSMAHAFAAAERAARQSQTARVGSPPALAIVSAPSATPRASDRESDAARKPSPPASVRVENGAAQQPPKKRGMAPREECSDDLLIELINEGGTLDELAAMLSIKPKSVEYRMRRSPRLWAVWREKHPALPVGRRQWTKEQRAEQSAVLRAHYTKRRERRADGTGVECAAPAQDDGFAVAVQALANQTGEGAAAATAESPTGATVPTTPSREPVADWRESLEKPAQHAAASLSESQKAAAIDGSGAAAAANAEREFCVGARGGGRVVVRFVDGQTSAIDLRLAAAALEALADEADRARLSAESSSHPAAR